MAYDVFNIRINRCHAALAAILLAACVSTGCQMKVAQVQARTEPVIENAYLGVLDELTGIMRNQKAEPAQQLEKLRKWSTDNHSRVSKIIEQFNQDVLAISPEQRERWRAAAQPELEKRLDDYAKNQLAFQKRLNDAQKWELGEILAQLK